MVFNEKNSMLETVSVSELLILAETQPPDALRDKPMPLGISKASFGRRSDYLEHMEMLAEEFRGQYALEFAHAATIVRIRRQMDLATQIPRFYSLWEEEGEELIRRLDSRWLISACDTLVDYGRNDAERAYGMAGSLFMNTIKLYETEILLCGGIASPDLGRLNSGAATALFDGMTAFTPRGGDMIENLATRISVLERNGFAACILKELFARARSENTAFQRLTKATPRAVGLYPRLRRKLIFWGRSIFR